MDGLGKMLRERARSLGLSDSEVARRVGLSQARYHNYVADTTEPDLGTLVRICRTLSTSPDELLAFVPPPSARTEADVARERLASAAASMGVEELVFVADMVEAMMAIRRRRPATATKRRPAAKARSVRATAGPG